MRRRCQNRHRFLNNLDLRGDRTKLTNIAQNCIDISHLESILITPPSRIEASAIIEKLPKFEAFIMEELFTLKQLLLKGDIQGAIAIVEELEEMSRDDKINAISSYAVILLLHLIKQQAENRTTRSWEVSIRNSVRMIQQKNKRRQSGGYYLPQEDLRLALEEAYPEAIDRASLEVEEGRYQSDELVQVVDRQNILNQAMLLIIASEQLK